MSGPGPASPRRAHWQTTISERGGIICVSVPQPSRESAILEAVEVERKREWQGRAIAPDAEVLVELWDEASGRALDRSLMRATEKGVDILPVPPSPELAEPPAVGPVKKTRKPGKKKGQPGRKPRK